MPQMRAVRVRLEHILEAGVRHDGTLAHHAHAVHVRSAALSQPVPVDGRRLAEAKPVVHLLKYRVNQIYNNIT